MDKTNSINKSEAFTTVLHRGIVSICKLDFARVRLPASVFLSTLAVSLPLLMPITNVSAQSCGNFMGAGLTLNPPSGSKVRVGDTITIIRVSAGLIPGACPMTNGEIYLAYPDGTTVTKISQNFSLDPAGTTFFDCTGAAGAASPFCLGFTPTYTVAAADIEKTLTINLPKKGLRTSTGVAGQVRFFAAAEADAQNPDGNFAGVASNEGDQFLIVVHPQITITKECVNPCTPYGEPILFTGTVCNTGDTPLSNIALNNNPPGTFAFPATKSNGQPFTGSLNPGECIDYTGSYQPAGTGTALCGPFTNTVTASGTAVGVFGNPTITSPPASATCLVCASPACPPSRQVIIRSPRTNEGYFEFTFTTELEVTYTVEFTESMFPADWHELTTFGGDGEIAIVQDAMTDTQRFYRVKVGGSQ